MLTSARALPPSGTAAIALFEHPNYEGRMVVLYGSNPNLGSVDFHDAMSSFIVTGGSWTLCEHPDYQGKCTGKYEAGKYPGPGPLGHDVLSSARND